MHKPIYNLRTGKNWSFPDAPDNKETIPPSHNRNGTIKIIKPMDMTFQTVFAKFKKAPPIYNSP